MAIISNIRKYGQDLKLNQLTVDIEDKAFLSDYFVLSEYNPKLTAGKNTFLLNGSTLLAPNVPIQIEVLDVEKNSLYVEMAKSNNISYTEGAALRVAVYVYNDTPFGVGSLTIVSKTVDGKTVRWTGNIQINSTIQNTSKVVFYKSPLFEVESAIVPIGFNSSISNVTGVSGSMYTLAINPKKEDDFGLFDISVGDIDYRMVITEPSVYTVSSMKNIPIELHIHSLNESNTNLLNTTSSNIILDVIDEKTIKLKNPIYYINNENKKIVSDITDGYFKTYFTNVLYNTEFQNNSTATSQIFKQSIAKIRYTNIKTFCGNVFRHKLYRRSLSTAGDFEIVADEPVTPVEVLLDNNTPNSYFRNLGSFPNDIHINHYWFSSSEDLVVSRDASKLMDAIKIENANNDSEYYLIVKNDTSTEYRNSIYVPCVENEILNESGSSYDSNFMTFLKDVPYKLSFKTHVIKSNSEFESSVSFYITSSMLKEIEGDINFDSNKGLKIGEIVLNQNLNSVYHYDTVNFYNTFQNDFYGTLVIYTKNCLATISNITLSTYSEPSFSPDVFITHIPFPISVAGEQFEIKAELLDVNSNLIHSDLKVISIFDPGGDTLAKRIPGIIGNDSVNGVKFFNVIISSSKMDSPYHGLLMEGQSHFSFVSSGSGISEENSNFYIRNGTVSISPKKSGTDGGRVYIKPDNGLEISPHVSTPGNIYNTSIGSITPQPGQFTTLTVPNVVGNYVTLTPNSVGIIDNINIGQSISAKGMFTELKSNGSGLVDIDSSPVGTIDNINIGQSTPAKGKFTKLSVDGGTGDEVYLGPGDKNVTLWPSGTGKAIISSGVVGTIDNMNIGVSTPGSGNFSSLSVPTTSSPFPGNPPYTFSPDGWLLINGKKVPFFN